MEDSTSTSTSTIRSLHVNMDPQTVPIISQPSSPHSVALPSPPDSPSPSDSISSLPSISSSFFFSSAADSPLNSNPPSDHARESTQGLIIPSLTLPSPLRRPTPYGQTLGDLRLLVFGSKGSGKRYISGLLVEDNEDVVEVGPWEDGEHGCSVLRASTDWIEHSDAHGLEKFEPSKNVEIIKLPGYQHNDNPDEILKTISLMIEEPFHSTMELLDPQRQSSAALSNLLSSPSSPLNTALIFLLSSTPSSLDSHLIDILGPQIPIILIPQPAPYHFHISRNHILSSFRPSSTMALRAGLFHRPGIVSSLRTEAADRFLRWREVERAVRHIADASVKHFEVDWCKKQWEAEWESMLSQDVARARRSRDRDNTLTQKPRNIDHSPSLSPAVSQSYSSTNTSSSSSSSPPPPSFDPLHFPSLVFLSFSLLRPARERLEASVWVLMGKLRDWDMRIALVGSFCVGMLCGRLFQ